MLSLMFIILANSTKIQINAQSYLLAQVCD